MTIAASSRRAFLSLASAALAGGRIPLAAASVAGASTTAASALYDPGHRFTGPDADLLTVCGFAARLRRDRDAKRTVNEEDPDLDLFADIESEALEWIAKHPATTPAGLSAKAEAMRTWLPPDAKGGLHPEIASTGDRLAWSLADDLARLAA